MAFVVSDRWSARPRPIAGRWKPSDRLVWLADPSWLAGLGSIADIFGTARWHDPGRLTLTGSRVSLNYDMLVAATDFWKAMDEEAGAEKLDLVAAGQTRLFDPASFR